MLLPSFLGIGFKKTGTYSIGAPAVFLLDVQELKPFHVHGISLILGVWLVKCQKGFQKSYCIESLR